LVMGVERVGSNGKKAHQGEKGILETRRELAGQPNGWAYKPMEGEKKKDPLGGPRRGGVLRQVCSDLRYWGIKKTTKAIGTAGRQRSSTDGSRERSKGGLTGRSASRARNRREGMSDQKHLH